MKRCIMLSTCAIALGTACASASDLNPLGFYLGAGAGQAGDIYNQLHGENHRDTGWKVVAGLRPIPFLGAELEYLDFGSESFAGTTAAGTARARAGGLFAVSYWPILPATLDLFAKVGGERVHTTADGVFGCVLPPPGGLSCNAIGFLHSSWTQSDFAYGGGLQARLRALGLRMEYERTDTAVSHPRLLSAGITYTF
jgi:opacity protein-like surface antigen